MVVLFIRGKVRGCEPARPLERPLGPFGPEMPKKSRTCLPGSPAPEPKKKSPKSLGNSLGGLRRVSGKCPKESFSDCFLRLFGDFSGFPGPHETFSKLFRRFGPEGPEGPLQGAGWFATKG